MDPDTTPPQVPSQQPVPQQPPQVQPQNFQSSPQIPETEQGDGGSKKTILVVGMIIVFLLLIVGAVGAVLLLSGDEEDKEDTTTTVSQTDEDTTVAEEPADNDDDVTGDNNDDNDDDSAGWQTCSLEDEVLGFYVEMQIPPDWTCTEGQSPQGLKTTTIADGDLDFFISMPLEGECQADNCDEETLYEDENLEVIRTSWQNPDGSDVGVVRGHFMVDGEPEESYFIMFGEMDLTNQQVETLTPVFESIAFVK